MPPRGVGGRNTPVNPYHQEAQETRYQWFDYNTGVNNRDCLVAKYSWAIPNDNAIRLLASMGPVIEIGAGNGYWSHLIAKAGGSITAYDPKPGKHHIDSDGRVWHPVLEGGVEKVQTDHKKHTLLLVWPPYNTPMAFDALLRFIQIGGQTLAYVGEGEGGCTADDDFFKLLHDNFEPVGDAPLPQWEGIHDHLTVYRRI